MFGVVWGFFGEAGSVIYWTCLSDIVSAFKSIWSNAKFEKNSLSWKGGDQSEEDGDDDDDDDDDCDVGWQ